MKPKNYIFGYGSLVNLTSLQSTIAKPDLNSINYQYCHLLNHTRIWNVGMDNSKHVPNYKYYINPSDGQKPDVFVTFLNIQEAPDCNIKGILFEVSAEELKAFDSRERQYFRKDITNFLDIEVDGIAWTYIGLEESTKGFEEAFANQRAVISVDYLKLVESAYQTLSEADLVEFRNSTVNSDLLAVELKRVNT